MSSVYRASMKHLRGENKASLLVITGRLDTLQNKTSEYAMDLYAMRDVHLKIQAVLDESVPPHTEDTIRGENAIT